MNAPLRTYRPPAAGTQNHRSSATTRVAPFAHLHISQFANSIPHSTSHTPNSLHSSDLSIWLSVDPMSDKYPSLSTYVYCADNPVKLVDPNGEEIINGYAQDLSDVRDYVDELTMKFGGLAKGTREYRTTRRDLNEAQGRLDRIQDKYNIVETAITDFKDRCPDEFEMLNSLENPSGFEIDVIVTLKYNLNNNLYKGQSIIEWSKSVWQFPTYDVAFYWFEPIQIYLNPKACLGRDDLGATLAHEGGHSFYEASNPDQYRQWLNDNGHFNEIGYDGHTGYSPSGIEAKNWEDKFNKIK